MTILFIESGMAARSMGRGLNKETSETGVWSMSEIMVPWFAATALGAGVPPRKATFDEIVK
jgi:hypothetical protein